MQASPLSTARSPSTVSTLNRFLLPALLGSLVFTQSAMGDSRRENRWETSVQMIATDSDKSSGENQSEVDVNGTVGLGFGAAYNLDNNFALGFDFNYLEPDYKAVFNTGGNGLVSVRHEMDVFNHTMINASDDFDPAITSLRLELGWILWSGF